ncbi:hypothetical protein [Cytophaga aurantiaca]|uniref:hypothetical protein n=1 Tax=Cytophaga aurantiaca TaxID=29530 RepID=UPI000370F20B|nr:hypothetical protein [Cytophaga aurantiaca]
METNNKNEIITLILADMRSRKLLIGLEATGLCTDDFNTDLSELIFSKFEIPKQHLIAINNWYEDTVFSMLETDLNKFRQNQLFLADRLYYELLQKTTHCQVMVTPKNKFTVYALLDWAKLPRFDN